jgi:hypothetical protein
MRGAVFCPGATVASAGRRRLPARAGKRISMTDHLGALTPGQRPAQLPGQRRDHRCNRVPPGFGAVAGEPSYPPMTAIDGAGSMIGGWRMASRCLRRPLRLKAALCAAVRVELAARVLADKHAPSGRTTDTRTCSSMAWVTGRVCTWRCAVAKSRITPTASPKYWRVADVREGNCPTRTSTGPGGWPASRPA